MTFREAAVQEGREEGIQQGIQQSIQQGMQQGMQQERSKLIRQMLTNSTPEAIAKLLDCPVSEIHRFVINTTEIA